MYVLKVHCSYRKIKSLHVITCTCPNWDSYTGFFVKCNIDCFQFPGSRRRHNSFDGGIPGYVRNVPSLAGHLAGRIVNDALDGMFRHGSVGSGRVPKTTLTPTPSATSTYRRSPSSKISSRSAHKRCVFWLIFLLRTNFLPIFVRKYFCMLQQRICYQL